MSGKNFKMLIKCSFIFAARTSTNTYFKSNTRDFLLLPTQKSTNTFWTLKQSSQRNWNSLRYTLQKGAALKVKPDFGEQIQEDISWAGWLNIYRMVFLFLYLKCKTGLLRFAVTVFLQRSTAYCLILDQSYHIFIYKTGLVNTTRLHIKIIFFHMWWNTESHNA